MAVRSQLPRKKGWEGRLVDHSRLDNVLRGGRRKSTKKVKGGKKRSSSSSSQCPCYSFGQCLQAPLPSSYECHLPPDRTPPVGYCSAESVKWKANWKLDSLVLWNERKKTHRTQKMDSPIQSSRVKDSKASGNSWVACVFHTLILPRLSCTDRAEECCKLRSRGGFGGFCGTAAAVRECGESCAETKKGELNCCPA